MNHVSYGNLDRNMNRAPKTVIHRVAPGRNMDEDKAWSQLYRSIRDPDAAAEVAAHLEADEQTLRQCTALYLCARQTLRRERARVARNQRIGQAVRAAFASLASLFASARRSVRHGGDLALEVVAPQPVDTGKKARSLPSRAEPAVKHVRTNKKDLAKEFAPMPPEVAAGAKPASASTPSAAPAATPAAGNQAAQASTHAKTA